MRRNERIDAAAEGEQPHREQHQPRYGVGELRVRYVQQQLGAGIAEDRGDERIDHKAVAIFDQVGPEAQRSRDVAGQGGIGVGGVGDHRRHPRRQQRRKHHEAAAAGQRIERTADEPGDKKQEFDHRTGLARRAGRRNHPQIACVIMT